MLALANSNLVLATLFSAFSLSNAAALAEAAPLIDVIGGLDINLHLGISANLGITFDQGDYLCGYKPTKTTTCNKGTELFQQPADCGCDSEKGAIPAPPANHKIIVKAEVYIKGTSNKAKCQKVAIGCKDCPTSTWSVKENADYAEIDAYADARQYSAKAIVDASVDVNVELYVVIVAKVQCMSNCQS